MPEELKFLNKFTALKFLFTMEKLWYYRKKIIVLYRKTM